MFAKLVTIKFKLIEAYITDTTSCIIRLTYSCHHSLVTWKLHWHAHYTKYEEVNAWDRSIYSWWRHQIETFYALQRPVTRLNKRLSKQSWGWWFETLSCPLWRHSNVYAVFHILRTLMCHVAPSGLSMSRFLNVVITAQETAADQRLMNHQGKQSTISNQININHERKYDVNMNLHIKLKHNFSGSWTKLRVADALKMVAIIYWNICPLCKNMYVINMYEDKICINDVHRKRK